MNATTGRVLVSGAGAGGVRSAMDLAQMGYRVLLIDKSDRMGGFLNQLDTQFPAEGCGYCRGLPMFDRDAASQHCLKRGLFHDNIEILLSTQVLSIDGEPGDFNVTLRQSPAMINPDLCTGCGRCADVCPVEVPDPFNAGLTLRKAVYLPSPQSFLNTWTIDIKACTRCGACEKACPEGAIRLTDQDRKRFGILVVDDEKIVRDSMKEWLIEEGFSVETADSGSQALALMQADENKKFHMMLTDIKMPGMDGVELLSLAKQENPDLAVIMMTAYADVDSAVEAMKQGALDYLTKPFDPDVLIAMTREIFDKYERAQGKQEKVDAVILSQGAELFYPALRKNPLGYGVLPGVVTSLEMERMLSGTGPDKGQCLHPITGKPIKKIAWIQCTGSRDIQEKSAFCSSACCMISIKQAALVQKKAAAKGQAVETTVFYMDLRTMGKPFEAYRQEAERTGVKFVRARIHTLENRDKNDNSTLWARYTDLSGNLHDDRFDLAVLAVGARPGKQTRKTAAENNIELNEWDFIQPVPFSTTQTSRPGILAAGTVTGFNDINESVISGSAAAMDAVRIIRQAGKIKTKELNGKYKGDINVLSRQSPRISIVLCLPENSRIRKQGLPGLKDRTLITPDVVSFDILGAFDPGPASSVLRDLSDIMEKHHGNRLIFGITCPHAGTTVTRDIKKTAGLPGHLTEILYIDEKKIQTDEAHLERSLNMMVSKARFINPKPNEHLETVRPEDGRRALVIGGGIAGITCALDLADAGCRVDLVEKTSELGGNLLWMDRSIDGHDIHAFLADQIKKVQSHADITLHTDTRIEGTVSHPGGFTTFLSRRTHKGDNTQQSSDQMPDQKPDREKAIYHGAVILATGGTEVPGPTGHDAEQKPPVNAQFTQKEFRIALDTQVIHPENLEAVVMIQCSGTRVPPSKNYCSRVCCIRALKTALELVEKNPDIQVAILYRDMMSYGFYETWYQKAREKGVLFFQYDLDHPPVMRAMEDGVRVTVRDHVLDRPVEIEADCVVHATGIASGLTGQLAQSYGTQCDEFGFFKEADYKFRPVDSMNYRVFSCGLTLKPCTINEAISTAKAAAARALTVLSREVLHSGKIVSHTRQATCTLCEMCVGACPYQARTVDLVAQKIVIDPAACQGCGVCASVCPSDSAILEGFGPGQMLDMIDMSLTPALKI